MRKVGGEPDARRIRAPVDAIDQARCLGIVAFGQSPPCRRPGQRSVAEGAQGFKLPAVVRQPKCLDGGGGEEAAGRRLLTVGHIGRAGGGVERHALFAVEFLVGFGLHVLPVQRFEIEAELGDGDTIGHDADVEGVGQCVRRRRLPVAADHHAVGVAVGRRHRSRRLVGIAVAEHLDQGDGGRRLRRLQRHDETAGHQFGHFCAVDGEARPAVVIVAGGLVRQQSGRVVAGGEFVAERALDQLHRAVGVIVADQHAVLQVEAAVIFDIGAGIGNARLAGDAWRLRARCRAALRPG